MNFKLKVDQDTGFWVINGRSTNIVAVGVPEVKIHQNEYYLNGVKSGILETDEIKPTTTYKGKVLTQIGLWEGDPVSLTKNVVTPINTGIDMSEVDEIAVSWAASGGVHTSTSSISMGKGFPFDTANGGLLHWYNTTYIRVRINKDDISSGLIHFTLLNASGHAISSIKFLRWI